MTTKQGAFKWRAIGNRVIVAPKPIEKEHISEAGIITNKPTASPYVEGEVLAVGDNVHAIKLHDWVLFSPLAYEELPDGLVVIEENDVFASTKKSPHAKE